MAPIAETQPDLSSIEGERPSVLILAHTWPPAPWIGAVRPVYLSRQLALHGWHPIVITVREERTANQNSEGIAGAESALVIRTRYLPSPRHVLVSAKHAIRRLAPLRREKPADSERSYGLEEDLAFRAPGLKQNLVSLLYAPDEFSGWLPFALRAASRALRRYKPQCVISTGPPHTSHLVALALKHMYRIAWIADLRDPWAWHDHPPGTHTLWSDHINRRLESAVVRGASRVVCVAPGVTAEYARRYAAEPSEKWVTITNGFDRDEFRSLGQIERAERFTISFVGSLSFQRSPLLLLRALAELLSEGTIDRNRVSARFIGDCEYVGRQSLTAIIRKLDLQGVAEVVPLIPRPQALRELLRSHVLLLIAGSQRLSISAKLFEYLAAGRPILAISSEGASAEIVQRLGVGRVVGPDDLQGAKDAIRHWYREFTSTSDTQATCDMPQADGRLEYDWARLGLRYAELIRSCATASQGGTRLP